MNIKNIVVVLEDGVIKDILTDEGNCKAVVVDRYVEGLDDAQVKVVENEEAFVFTDEVNVDPERVQRIFSEAGINPLPKGFVNHQKALIEESIDSYCEENGITLTEEQKYDAIRGVDFWLSDALRESVSDSVCMVDDVAIEGADDEEPTFTETLDSFEKLSIEEFNKRFGCNATKEMNFDDFADYLDEDDELSYFCISLNGQDVLDQVYDEWEVASRLKIDYLLVGDFYVAIY